MTVVHCHPDVTVVVSRLWETTATLVRAPGGGAAVLIDAPVLPGEIAATRALAAEQGLEIGRLLATHRHWDHMLGRLAFPAAELLCAQRTLAHLRADPQATARAMAEFDDRYYLRRPDPLRLDGARSAPVPGALALGDAFVELVPTAGHCEDGLAVWLPWARTLVCGDYVSPLELPYLEAPDGSLPAYADTLDRLAPLVAAAELVVPGHGAPMDGAAASRVLDEDRRYLADLAERGHAAPLPRGADSAFQRFIHAENVRISAAA
jgi:glyoxylase-like metal-dependent hydrolase (beta-lactamase superfamily II)